MKILYIDKVDSYECIRIAEQNIFGKQLPEKGVNIDILIRRNVNHKYDLQHIYTWTKSKSRKRLYFLLDFLSIIRKANYLIRKEKHDIIIARKNLTTGYAAWFLSRVYKKKYVYLLSFPTWETIKARGENRMSWCLLSKIYRSLAILLVRHSDLVVTKTSYIWESLGKEYDLNGINYLSLPMGFDESMRPESLGKSGYRDELDIPEISNVMIYFGSMEKERNLEFLIDIVSQLRNRIDNFRCFMIGGTSEQCDALKRHASHKGVSRETHIISWLDRPTLYKYLIASDICISPLPPVPAFVISSPTKVVESLALGVPVIANLEIHEQKEIIEESRSGKLVPYDTEAFMHGIATMFQDQNELRAMGKRGMEYIDRNRSYRNMANSLHQALVNLGNKHGHLA